MAELVFKDAFDTARLVACYRAIESERPGALLHDSYARRLAGKRGEELVRAYSRSAKEVWGTVLRTCVYDDILLRTIEQGQVDTVINLAAGLDARPYRLALPASLHWIEVDLPAVLQYKEELLANEKPGCQLERVPLDVTDREALKSFLASVSEESKQIFILTEGLLVYLTTEQVSALASDLCEQEAIHLWLTEFTSRLPPEKIKQAWNSIAAESVQERFAPASGAGFFAEYGWQVVEFHAAIRAILRFRVPVRLLWFLRLLRKLGLLLPETNTTQPGFVVLQRAPSQAAEMEDLQDETSAAQPEFVEKA